MGRLGEKPKEVLWNAAIIAVGLLLMFVLLMLFWMIAIGGPVALFGLIVGMMGAH